MEFWLEWILLVSVFGVALASPGPDFVIAVRNSILYGRFTGILTALGFAVGVCIHVTYVLIGLAAIIAQSVWIFNIIKYAGAAYLFYIAYKSLMSKGFEGGVQKAVDQMKNNTMSPLQAFTSGFLTNLLNPKATLFFMAVFTQFTGVDTTFVQKAFFASTCVVMTGLWFSLVSVTLTQTYIRQKFFAASQWIDRICGVLLIGLGIRLLLTKGTSS